MRLNLSRIYIQTCVVLFLIRVLILLTLLQSQLKWFPVQWSIYFSSLWVSSEEKVMEMVDT